MSYEKYKIYNGKSIKDWSRETGIKSATIQYRIKHGMSIEDAVSAPVKSPSKCAKKHDVLGKTFTDRFGNEFIVEELSYRDKYSVAYYKCKFIKSEYITYAPVSQIIHQGHSRIQDRLSPSVHGVGILGLLSTKENSKLFDVWRAMIARCYNHKNPSYKTYGAKGVTVCERWKRFDYFLEDVKSLPNYNINDINNGLLVLDKDIINKEAKCYSPETCSFVSRAENTKESANRMWKERKV